MNTYDVAPALKEIREKLYEPIRQHVEALFTSTWLNRNWPDTVVVVGPKQTRRKEDAWYKPGAWLSKQAGALATMSHTKKPAPLDEIVVAGEALALPPRQLAEAVLHATVHQTLAVYYGTTSQRHDLAIYRHVMLSTLGLALRDSDGYAIKWSDVVTDRGKQLDALLDQLVSTLDEDAFDLSRLAKATTAQPSRLKLWMCPKGCGPKIRTGGFLRATCEPCGSTIQYADKDRLDPATRVYLEAKFGSSRVMP